MARRAAAALCFWALFHAAAAVGVVSGDEGSRKRLVKQQLVAKSFLRNLQFKHKLRICNAYPFGETVDVYQGSVKLTEKPIKYKSCAEVSSPVKAGDKLQFQIGGMSAGSFAVSELPSEDAVLVLVIYRHDTVTTAVAFESHVFANLLNAQIAVLDTYRGVKRASLRVQDGANATTSRSEELRFDSVVSVNQGIYEVVLTAEDGEVKDKEELVALNRECYVVVRCGVEAEKEEQAYPQELMVFPHSDSKVLQGAAATWRSLPVPALLMVALTMVLTTGAEAAEGR